MTSKEALSYLNDIAHGRKMDLDSHELYLTVKKDLEVLELLKSQFNYSYQATWYIDFDEYCLDENSEENKMIKEWLEND